MKLGDLVKRKIKGPIDLTLEENTGKIGMVIEKHISGTPPHRCVTVFYPYSNKTHSIAESLLEVVSETR